MNRNAPLNRGLSCQVMAWIGEYHETLRELGIEEDALQFASGIDNGTYLLTDKYISRVENTLIAWFTNILEVRHQRPSSQSQYRSSTLKTICPVLMMQQACCDGGGKNQQSRCSKT